MTDIYDSRTPYFQDKKKPDPSSRGAKLAKNGSGFAGIFRWGYTVAIHICCSTDYQSDLF
ncbi:hypothetical protein E4659_13940 [Dickeya dianthicola]|uniref:hypothetical protein n=1 Tax=Dickeya dianthicola TaxID=204039 RepID=UPI0011874E7A|nr:hypothetical protein [Dickeya dianthicola]MBI0437608.1 hypothetical protein [Dickeya dianthicola]MBI0447870.1 hypothetical protein [Dickeya dianthicola]MBI0452487.1 hypothetical protein [Dickeya dianthicola]MBI0456980.1 hypothetical protein [Dickeya dianthicola]MBI0461339.1 hypothetical protein [Dickeya dianthicola]